MWPYKFYIAAYRFLVVYRGNALSTANQLTDSATLSFLFTD